MGERLLRPRQAAEILNCSGSFIYKLIDSGKLKAVKIPPIGGTGKHNKKHFTRIKESDLWTLVGSYHNG